MVLQITFVSWEKLNFVLNVSKQKVHTLKGYVLPFGHVRICIIAAHVVYGSIFPFLLRTRDVAVLKDHAF